MKTSFLQENKVSDFSYTPVAQFAHGFARFLISHIHLRFYRIYMKNKLFTRSLIACASGSAAGITKEAGRSQQFCVGSSVV